MYLEVPEVSGCVDTIVNYVTGDGYEIDAKSELHKKRVTELLKQNHFSSALKDIVYSQNIYGDAYLELLRGGQSDSAYLGSISDDLMVLRKRFDALRSSPGVTVQKGFVDDNKGAFAWEDYSRGFTEPADYLINPHSRFDRVPATTEFVSKQVSEGQVRQFFSRDASTIRVDYNEHGEPIKYIQRVLHRRVDFYPSEMIHLPMNVIGNRVYGTSPLSSIIRTARIKFDAEEYSSDWLLNGGVPRMLYKLIGFNDEQFKRTSSQLQNNASGPYQRDIMLAVPNKDAFTAEQIVQKNVDMQWAEFLKYLREQIFIQLRVPPSLLGASESSNRAVADVNMSTFFKRIKGNKRELEDQLNLLFFNSDVIGFDDVTFRFKEDNVTEELKKAQKVQLISTVPIFTKDELRSEYGLPPLTAQQKAELLEDQQQKVLASGKFNSGQPGAQQPNRNPDKEQSAERVHSEEANITRVGKKYYPRLEQGPITTHNTRGEKAPYWDWEHPRGTNTDTPESRYPLGAQEDVSDPHEGGTPYQQTRNDEIREAARNDIPNSFDLNSDRVLPKDKKPKRYKPKAEKEKLEQSDRDHVNEMGRPAVGWANTYGASGGASTSQPRENKALEEKVDQIVSAVRFIKKSQDDFEKKLGGV